MMMKRIVFLLLIAMLIILCSCSAEMPISSTSDPLETIDAHESKAGDATNMNYDFTIFTNVSVTGTDIKKLSDVELSVLYVQARYCQAMTDADIETMREIVSEDMTFTHMSGMKQTREEYFADIEDGSLNYFTIGIENPVVTVNEDTATVTFTSVLNANAYGARGTYRMKGTHHYEKRNGKWIAVNG